LRRLSSKILLTLAGPQVFIIPVSFFARNLQIFKRIGLPLFVLTLIYTSLDQVLTLNIDEALRTTEPGAMNWIWLYGFLSLVTGIVFPILGLLVVLYGAKTSDASERGLYHFIQQHLNQLSIEILRSWGKTLMWSLVLIVPGLWKYIEYTLIPFVVTASKRYDRGETDALLESSRVVKQHLLKVCAILLVFHLILPAVLTVFFDDYRLVWHTPLPALVLTLLDVYLFIISTQLLLDVFEKDLEEISHAESYV
jgi:hypothetical protein